jgi:hypothetical protein
MAQAEPVGVGRVPAQCIIRDPAPVKGSLPGRKRPGQGVWINDQSQPLRLNVIYSRLDRQSVTRLDTQNPIFWP